MKRYEGKSVLITGAASGFGQRAAERFAKEGARLTIADIAGEGLAETAELVRKAGGEVVSVKTDVSKEADVEKMVAEAVKAFGPLHVAINNAGIAHTMARLPDISTDDYNRVMAVNTTGVFLGMKYEIPVMLEQLQGVILNTSSVAGIVGAAMMSAYAASKHAVVGLTRSAAEEYARRGIRVNCICPAFAATPIIGAAARNAGPDGDQARASLTRRLPMGRIGGVDEIVQAMLWICSDENSFMTGHALAVDGGLSAI